MKKIVSYVKKHLPYPRYKNPFKTLKERFIDPEQKDINWRERIDKCFEEKPGFVNSIKTLALTGFTKLSPKKDYVARIVECFTLDSVDDIFLDKEIDDINSQGDIKVARRGRESLNIQMVDRNMSITKLSSIINGELSDDEIQLLSSKDRYGRCHSGSVKWACGLEGNVVTGLHRPFSKKHTVLHSWVEICNDFGQTLVLDYTKNIILQKEDYYYLYNIKPIQTTTHSQIKQDWGWVKELVDIDSNYIKMYLSSRNEAKKHWDKIKEQAIKNNDKTEEKNNV